MSKDMKHTPGPWSLSLNAATGAFAIEDDNRIAVICSRADWSHRASESAANARLVAAAPELLAALQRMRAITYRHISPACDAADAAIAKATESPSTERDGGEAKRSTPENRT